MREGHADQGHRKFWPLMKSMTWKERFQHLLYYYGKYALLAALLIILGVSAAYDMLTPDKEVLLSGTTVSVGLSDELEEKLTDGAFEAMGGTDRRKQTITLEPTVINILEPSTLTSLQTKFYAGDYQYVLMDETGLEKLNRAQVIPNLKQVLSAERLAQWQERLYTISVEDTDIPIAIDITDTALAEGCTYEGEKLYISFPAVQDKVAIVEPFLEYLTAQGLLEIQ